MRRYRPPLLPRRRCDSTCIHQHYLVFATEIGRSVTCLRTGGAGWQVVAEPPTCCVVDLPGCAAQRFWNPCASNCECHSRCCSGGNAQDGVAGLCVEAAHCPAVLNVTNRNNHSNASSRPTPSPTPSADEVQASVEVRSARLCPRSKRGAAIGAIQAAN